MVFKRIIFQNRYVELETPLPFMEKSILNFHFGYLHPSLICCEISFASKTFSWYNLLGRRNISAQCRCFQMIQEKFHQSPKWPFEELGRKNPVTNSKEALVPKAINIYYCKDLKNSARGTTDPWVETITGGTL